LIQHEQFVIISVNILSITAILLNVMSLLLSISELG